MANQVSGPRLPVPTLSSEGRDLHDANHGNGMAMPRNFLRATGLSRNINKKGIVP